MALSRKLPLSIAAFSVTGLIIMFFVRDAGVDRERSGIYERSRKFSQEKDGKKIKSPGDKIMIGAFDPKHFGGKTSFEANLGRNVDVVSVYQAWGGADPEFNRGQVELFASLGKVPLITWEPWVPSETDFDQPDYRLRLIAQGKYDAYLRRWLKAAGEWNGPIFVRFAQEMNGNWYPWGVHANSPKDYVDAWRHVVGISREVGADNITWVWSPNESDFRNDLRQFYPGDKYVDWVGVSGFNWGPAGPGNKWRSFAQIYDRTMRQLAEHDKPMMIAEIGSVEAVSGAVPQTKAAWIEETFLEIRRYKYKIGLVVWFNDVFKGSYDWRISTSPQSAAAIRKALSDQAFMGQGGVGKLEKE